MVIWRRSRESAIFSRPRSTSTCARASWKAIRSCAITCPGVVAMLAVPRVGPRRAQRFWQELNITSLAELASAAEAGRLRQLKGIGRKTERTILIGARAIQVGHSPHRDV